MQSSPARTIYRLAEVYRGLGQAAEAHDLATVDARLSRLFGFVAGANPVAATRVTSMLSLRGFKPAELAMLGASIKPVVKFEDIPFADAALFTARHHSHYRITQSQPYRKDGLMLRSEPAKPGADALVVLYVGRDERAQQLADLEANDQDDVQSAGALLGIPACCIDAFEADVRRSRVDEDTLNDDACRRVLLSAVEAPGDARLCPLSNLELLGFYPCHARCPAAIARANAVLAALETQRSGAANEVLRRLRGDYLFWRLPFFARLDVGADAVPIGPGTAEVQVSPGGLIVNVFPHQPAAAIQRRFAGLLTQAFNGGTHVSVVADQLVARRGDARLHGFAAAEQSPILARFV